MPSATLAAASIRIVAAVLRRESKQIVAGHHRLYGQGFCSEAIRQMPCFATCSAFVEKGEISGLT